MRLLKKLAIKLVTLVIMVGLMGGVMRYAKPYIMKAAGVPEGLPGTEGLSEAHFSSEESDLMGTVFKSALRLFSGTAKRDELAGELSDKLYAGRADSGTMSELGIELVKPGASPSPLDGAAAAANLKPGVSAATPQTAATTENPKPAAAAASSQPGASSSNLPPSGKLSVKPATPATEPPATTTPTNARDAILARLGEKALANPELTFIPVVVLGMFVVHLVRRRRSPEDGFVLPELAMQGAAETETYVMKHAVHSLKTEDFELLVALIYQRQGYRVSMPAGLGGGRGGDFTLLRKAEKLLVQCKRLSQEQKVPVEKVRELHEAAAIAGATRAMYVASCGFTWDARNFAKAKGMTLINSKTLDALLDAAREKPAEDLLAVAQWAAKLMTKVQLTPPLCPACEAAMDQLSVSNGSVWVCSQRPECRGRRTARNQHRPSKPQPQPQPDAPAETKATPLPPQAAQRPASARGHGSS